MTSFKTLVCGAVPVADFPIMHMYAFWGVPSGRNIDLVTDK